MQVTFCRFAMGGIFTTNVDAENQILINHKYVCGALNRHFCQTRVTSRIFFCCQYFVVTLFEKLPELSLFL